MEDYILTVYDEQGNPIPIPAIQGVGIKTIRFKEAGETEDTYEIVLDDERVFSFSVKHGKNYALTDADKSEIAEEAADLIDTSVYVTPQMFGAVGDGVTDDTQAFIDALESNGKVYVPKGTYVISSELDLTNGRSLYGVNGERGKLKFTGTSGNVIVLGEDSVFDSVDIWIPQKVDGNVFITDNRLINTTVSFLHTVVENTTIQLDAMQSESSAEKLTLININASNSAQGFCYQTYRNINVVRPNWNGLDVYAIYNNGIKMTLSADVPDKASLSWITHMNFENIFLGSPVTAIKCGHENNSGVDISDETSLIDHVLMTNVSAQVTPDHVKKFWDLGRCRIRAFNCKAWDYAEYVTDGKYGTIRKGAILSILPVETSPVDNFEFPDETSSSVTDIHTRLIDKYFTLIKPSTEGGTSVNDPRIARRLSAEHGIYNYTDVICPERLSNSIHKISGHVPSLVNSKISNYPVINGLQLNNGGFNGNGGAHTTILAITQDNHWVFRKYYSGDWFGNWQRIYSDTDDALLKEKMTSLSDVGNYFANKNVEDALQEIGAKLLELEAKLINQQ